MKRTLLVIMLCLGLATALRGQVTVPNTLVAGNTITAAGLNTNFTTIANHALDRLSGGNIAGNVTADPGITIDGVDIGVQACVSCTPTFAKLTLSDTSATSLTVGGGLTIGTGLVALVDTTGKIPAISSTTFASLSGANLTGLNAANLSAGAVPNARIATSQISTTTKTANYTAVAGDFVLASCASCTITLPAAASNTNAVIDVKSWGTVPVIIGVTGGDTIDGASTQTLSVINQSYTLVSNGAGWWIR